MNLGFERSYPTPLSNSTLLPLLLLSLARQRHSPEPSLKIKKEYDYIIVGAGTAGSVVASRLSELPCVSVLVLEAGHKPPLLTDVPALGKYFWFTDVDWQYRTVPQRFTGRALINRQVLLPRGKMLGGSSSMGALHYARGNRKNYDDWAAQGAKGWSFKDVYPYFLRMENNEEREFLANGYHTIGGPMFFHRPKYEPKFKQAIFKAATRMGYKIVDSNGEKQTGFFEHQAALRNNQRCSTAKAYLVPAENRTNLDILTNALVTKVIIRKQLAEGVQFEYNGHLHDVKARHEVIMSAGTINTAQLLMLSGLGPRKMLQQLDIPVIADLPVGQNLQDHASTNIPFVLDTRIPDFEEKISDRFSIRQYIENRTGPLSSTEGTSNLAFLKGQAIYTPNDFPNYQLQFTEMSTSVTRNHFGLKPEVYWKLYGPYENKPLLLCEVSQLQPRSRGTITLQSRNLHDSPSIDPNYLADPRDIEDMVQGMKTCQRIGTNYSLRKLGATPLKTLIPGCEKYATDEDKYFTCQLRSIVYSHHDPVGTAKMGDPKDPTTVVDPLLRVKNVEGLRIVDASVMPIITSGSTMIPTIMIAEKASEMIKDDISCYQKESEHWNDPDDSFELSPERKFGEDSSDEWERSNDVSCEEEYEIYEHVYEDPTKEEQKEKSYHKYYLKHSGYNSLANSKDYSQEFYNIPLKYPLVKDNVYFREEYYNVPHKQLLPKINDYSQEMYHNIPSEYSSPNKGYSEGKYNTPHNHLSSKKKNYFPELHDVSTNYPLPKNKNYSQEKYYEVPPKHPSSDDNKYYLEDYIKDPKELSTIKNEKESYGKPYSWYKKKTDLILNDINKSFQWKNGNLYPKTYQKDPYNYEVSKSIEELIKLADIIPDEIDYRWNEPYENVKVIWSP